MSEPNYPAVSADDVRRGRIDQATAAVLGLTFAGGLAAGYKKLNAPGGFAPRKAVQILTGVKVTPTPLGPGAATIPKLSYVALLIPQPVGIVPNEVYGGNPDAIKKLLGFRTGNKPPILDASEARVRVYAAKSAAEAIMSQVQGRTIRGPGVQGAIVGYELKSGPLPLSHGDVNYLRSLPAGVHPDVPKFLAALEGRDDDIGTPRPTTEGEYDVSEPRGHAVQLVTEGGALLEAIQTAPGVYVRIDATGRAVRP